MTLRHTPLGDDGVTVIVIAIGSPFYLILNLMLRREKKRKKENDIANVVYSHFPLLVQKNMFP